METKAEADVDMAASRFFSSSQEADEIQRELDIFGGLTVGQVVGPGLGGNIQLQMPLREAAEALAESGRTALPVSDGYSGLAGLFTENDVMRCYFEDAAPDRPVAEWLACGFARAPAKVLQRLSVLPTHTLAQVADRMVLNALAGDLACHHVLVEEDPDAMDGRLAVLSPLDMLQAFCRPMLWNCSVLTQSVAPPLAAGANGMKVDEQQEPVQNPHHGLAVEEVMKPKAAVFTCAPRDTMKDVVRILLMSHQNSVLVVDDEGIYGIMTSRDAVRAYAEGASSGMTVADWLRGLNAGVNSRIIVKDATIGEAAAMMTARGINHLVVVPPGGAEALGVVSSLDLALCARGARAPTALQAVRVAAPHDAGPTVGELVKQQWHLAAVCNRGATLSEVAALMATSGRTSMAVALGGDSPPLGLLTEMDIIRAYIDGWERDFTVERWMLIQESSRPALLPHLIVPPGVRITEAAALMLGAASRPGQDPCHHLVVKGSGFGWDGVFSALDVARALCGLESELDIAETGADHLRVSTVMKLIEFVPRCKPGDSLRDAFNLLLRARQCAVLVADDENGGTQLGLITPRCALQAFAEGWPQDRTVAELLRARGGAAVLTPAAASGGAALAAAVAAAVPREVSPDAPLFQAAATMTESCIHHLLVKAPGPSPALGVLSSLDLARGIAAVRCRTPFASLGWLAACRGPPACALWAA